MDRNYPREFTADLPDWVRAACLPAEPLEVSRCQEVRRHFLFPNDKEPWIFDIVRAFRLVRGMHRYVEVGTYDKGNLAFVSTLLAPDAVIVDVDIEPHEEQAAKLRESAVPSQRIHTIVGDSTSQTTVSQVKAALGGSLADAAFIDGNHAAAYAFSDYALYSPLVRPGGVIFMHDVYWRGDDTTLGTVFALREIDRVTPVYVVREAGDPVHRFLPPLDKEVVFGCVALIRRR